jgi:hypothetical protein
MNAGIRAFCGRIRGELRKWHDSGSRWSYIFASLKFAELRCLTDTDWSDVPIGKSKNHLAAGTGRHELEPQV